MYLNEANNNCAKFLVKDDQNQKTFILEIKICLYTDR